MRIILVAIFGWCFFLSPIHSQETLVLSSPDDLLVSISYTVLKEAYQKLNIDVQVKKFPAKRAIHMANDGESDGAVNRIMGMDKKYPNLIRVPVSINFSEIVIYTKTNDFVVNGWESLKPYRIGIRRGIKVLEDGTFGMNVDPVATNEQLFRKLDAGFNDVVLMGRIAGVTVLKTLPFHDLRILEPPLLTIKLYHYLHKKNAPLKPNITTVLHAMERSGRIHQIREEMARALLR